MWYWIVCEEIFSTKRKGHQATVDSFFQAKMRCFYLLLTLLHCKMRLDLYSNLYLSLYHRMTIILAAYAYTSFV